MKIEYSFSKSNPIIVVKGSEFIRALENQEEEDLLLLRWMVFVQNMVLKHISAKK